MSTARCLRVWRPSGRFVQTPTLRRPFHASRPVSAKSASLGQKRGVNSPPGEEDATEFKKMRLRALEDEAVRELYSVSHPRLEQREGRMSIPQFKDDYGQGEEADTTQLVTLYGRIQSIRRHSNKLMFLTLVNEVETIQGLINLKMVQPMTKEAFKLFTRLIERGDHISITGAPTRSSTGELVIEARELPKLLSPTMEPIPDCLTDPETRAHKRHVDMLVNPEVADTLRLKSHMMQYIRDYFLDNDFLEVQTPILAHNAGGAVARPFTTRATEFPSKELSLRVAPELWLKRLVIGGLNKVFEIGPAFRNEGIDGTHNPEFTTCEFYSAYTNLEDLITLTESLMRVLSHRCDVLVQDKLKSLPRINTGIFEAPFAQIEFIPALEEALGFRLPNLSGANALPELLAVLKLGGVSLPGGGVPATLPKLLDRLAAIYLEPQTFDKPGFITHHPACMSPLAKSFVCPRTGQAVSARAELFIGGRELANMYEEENDPVAQARKLAEHRAMTSERELDEEREAERTFEERNGEESRDAEANDRAEMASDPDMDAAPLDKSYIKAMEAGLPPTGGWGCGVERLVMLFSGTNRISDCLTFGTLRHVVGLTSEGGVPSQNGKKS